ncbi:BUB3-interacting and GLEBS motif-containing protein ZNF207 [Hetaerina americana]|uniref:BUB3-interacting and GLEBS motif-containing protein ZNF207 n=1 Tax=Hetaerina americana TaxID=62018 RepID=UPI003A7F3CE1
MGRKKKKQSKPWCWYCNREFDDEKILIQHQKAKHFKCHICHKKLYTGPGLSIHCMQVHKEAIDKVPNSLPNRSNIEIEIYGMEGIPEEDLKEHERQKHGRPHSPSSGEEDSAPKKPRPLLEITTSMPPSLQPVQSHIPPTASSSSPGIPPHHMAPGTPMMHHPPHLPPHLMGGPHPHPPMGGGAPPQHHPHHPGGPPPPPPFMPPGMHMMGPMGPMAPPPGTAPMATPPLANAQPPPPSKPLFPAAAAVAAAAGASNNQSTPVGADFKPLTGSSGGSQIGPVKPTFPAYSSANSSITSSASSTNETSTVPTAPSNSKPALINTTSASSRIIHPQEDISLEERRAMMPRYQPPATLRAPPSTTLTTPVNSVVSSAPSVGIAVPVSTAVSTANNAVAAAASAAAAATIAMAAGVGPPHPQKDSKLHYVCDGCGSTDTPLVSISSSDCCLCGSRSSNASWRGCYDETSTYGIASRVASRSSAGPPVWICPWSSPTTTSPSRGSIPSRARGGATSPPAPSSPSRATSLYAGPHDASTLQMIGMVARPHGSGGGRGSCNLCHGVLGPPIGAPTTPPIPVLPSIHPTSTPAGPSFPPSTTPAHTYHPGPVAPVEVRTGPQVDIHPWPWQNT